MSSVEKYRVYKETYGQAIRWKAVACYPDGKEAVLGHYPTRKAARIAVDLLTGWRFVRVGGEWVRKERIPA